MESDGQLGCLYFAAVNYAAINIPVHVPWCT